MMAPLLHRAAIISTGKTSSVITLQMSNFTMRHVKQQKGGKETGKEERKRVKTGWKKKIMTAENIAWKE